MAQTSPLQNDPAALLGINVVGQSPHVFVYRFWTKEPGETTWTILHDGDTQDEIPDNFTAGPFPDGTGISYWIAVAGKPSSAFRVSVIFAQGGKVPAGGAQTHNGKTTSKGGAVIEQQVVLV